jgi:hypothetical protein
MTLEVDKAAPKGAGRSGDDEIEVTPDMILAGVRELALCEPYDAWSSTVAAVYLAMEAARRHSSAS